MSFYGLAKGTARGGVPSSRISVYKICGADGKCNGEELLAAFDDAIADGVDIITLSIGSQHIFEFFEDPVAIGSFHAMEKGILTTHAAGNFGPDPSTTSSVAPWLFTVAATTIDRQFIDKLILGNGKTIIGKSINTIPSNGTKFPIAVRNAEACLEGHKSPEMCDCVDRKLVEGKLVLCGSPIGAQLAYSKGAIGTILNVPHTENQVSLVTRRRSLNLDTEDFVGVQSFVNSTKYPEAEILKSETIQDTTAPEVAIFSSRGPNPKVAEIMKPDISAPGVDILAAYSPEASPSDELGDNRKVKYNIEYGTSMACPHVAGVAAYVKSFHPDWSPAAIKSSIMTTATLVKGSYDLAGEFAYGSGNINPALAINPGLIYDITKEDYVKMLCNFGYDANKIKQISGENSSCNGASERSLVKDLNYPTIVIPVNPNLKQFQVNIHRTVTNVGFPNSTYKATVIHNPKINITVEPKLLSFKSLNEKQSFVVTVVGGVQSNTKVFSSSLIWSDGTHNVKSAIIVQRLS